MPRKARIDAPGAVHHTIVRGIERKRIFKDDLDRERFLERLGSVLAEGATGCFAWEQAGHCYIVDKWRQSFIGF
jgi:putative transposase